MKSTLFGLLLFIHLLMMPTANAALTSEAFLTELRARQDRIVTFQFIRELAEKHGLRVWLRGTSAMKYAMFVKWDLQRESGEADYQEERFQYTYANIFPMNEPLSLAADGPDEQIDAFEAELKDRFPILAGHEGERWRVAPLKIGRGEPGTPEYVPPVVRLTFFRDLDSTDSVSETLVELTRSTESLIRSARHWENPSPPLLRNILDNSIAFYPKARFSPDGQNIDGEKPLSLVRYLSHAFQFGLQIPSRDFHLLKQVVDHFSPSDIVPDTFIEADFIPVAKSMILKALSVERAYTTLDELGLRAKLARMGRRRDTDSLAYWMGKEPLRAYPLGSPLLSVNRRSDGFGRTAQELGLSGKVLSHETRDLAAYESINRPMSGEPNVFISRRRQPREAAAWGNGFYMILGQEGTRGTGLTVRAHLHPDAVSGIDFYYVQAVEYFVIRNKNAIRLVPERLEMSPSQYFELLAHGENVDYSNSALLERLRRHVTAHSLLSPQEYEKSLAIVQQAWRENRNLYIALEFANLGPRFRQGLGTELRGYVLTLEQARAVKRGDGSVQGIRAWLDGALSRVDNPSLMLAILEPDRPNPSREYLDMLSGLWEKFASRFIELKPTLSEIEIAKESTNSVRASIELIRAALPQARSAEEILVIMDPGTPFPSEFYQKFLAGLWSTYLDVFLASTPTPEQIEMAREIIPSADLRARLPQAVPLSCADLFG